MQPAIKPQDLLRQVPYSHAITEEVMAGGCGRQEMGFELLGTHVLTDTPQRLAAQHQALVQYLTQLPFGITVRFMCHRRQFHPTLTFDGQNAFARHVNTHYMQSLDNQLYVNRWFILLEAIPHKKITRLGRHHPKAVSALTRFLYEAASLSESALASYQLTRLKTTEGNDLLGVLLLPLNAGHIRQLPSHINCVLGVGKTHAKAAKTIKRDCYHLASIGLDYALGFDNDTIYYQGNTASQSRIGALCSLKHFPESSNPNLWDKLYHSAFDAIITHRYSPLSLRDAISRARKVRLQQQDVNREAVSLDASIGDLLDHIFSGQLGLGAYHQTVLVLADNREQLQQQLQIMTQSAHQQGMGLVRERFGLQAAFFSQLPGNERYAVRPVMLSSKTVADFASLHVESMGHIGVHHLKQPVALLKTPHHSPYWFNCHAKGSTHQMSSGHTLVFGASGMGKTVILAFLMCALQRFNGHCFVFDRNRGLELAVRALGGEYRILSANHPVGLNPFQLPDTPDNRSFLLNFLQAMVRQDGEMTLPGEITAALSQCVAYNYQCAKDVRRLSRAMTVLPIDFPRMDALALWCEGSADGVFFDSDLAPLTLCGICGFDVTYLMARGREKAFELVCRVLMHYCEQALDGRLATLIADEGWQWLMHPALSQMANEIFVTWRKLNGHMILATQSPERLVQSTLATTLIDNASTQIILPNAMAAKSIYCDALGLSQSELDWIKTANPNARTFLVKQACHSAIAQLDLSQYPDIVSLFSANVHTLKQFDALYH